MLLREENSISLRKKNAEFLTERWLPTVTSMLLMKSRRNSWQALGGGGGTRDSPGCDNNQARLVCRHPRWEVLSACSWHSTDEARDSRHRYSPSGRQMCISASLMGHSHHSNRPAGRWEIQNALPWSLLEPSMQQLRFMENDNIKSVP